MRKKLEKYCMIAVAFIMVISTLAAPISASAESSPREQFTVTPGVVYKDMRFVQNSAQQASRILDIDLNQPNIKVEMGIPNPINTLSTVSARAKAESAEGHRVVGAVNASFFHTKTKMPAYLVTWKENVKTLGVISTGADEFMSVPTAFGINAAGNAQIDSFAYDTTFEVNGQSTKVNSINKARSDSEIIVYTPNWSYSSTRTNSYGMEIIVENTSAQLDEGIEFGKPITGTVKAVTPYGQAGNSVIPSNGYVISIQGGTQAAKFANVQPGQEIKLNVNVEDKWKNSEFMLASGPMLVKDGKVSMTISENSSRAKEVAPRTAVAMDKSGKRVFLVTVDGRQSGYSKGMNLKQFAQYLVSLGADRAINLDGGGSTTLVARKHGNIYPTVMNSPSDGRERSVSTVLQVVNTAPTGPATTFEFKKASEGTLLKGTSIELQPQYAMDANYHHITVDPAQVTYSVEGDVGTIEGNKFVAAKEGSGYIVGRYGNAVKKVPVSVTETPGKVEVSPANTTMGPGNSASFSVKVYDENGKELVLPAGTVQWSVTNGIGTITPDGVFTAGTEAKTGTVKATVFKSSAQASVTIANKAEIINTFDAASAWKAESAKADTKLSLASGSEPYFLGSTSLKMNYDFTVGEAGIKASYAALTNPIALSGNPNYIGLWVYGDGANHWLRGKILDGSGTEHTINFTEEGQLNWKGWKYVRAEVPAGLKLPVKFSKLYVAESLAEKQNKGVLYFDKLQAEYGNSYAEPIFNDVPNTHWAKKEIADLSDAGIITGYSNGYFKPENTLTRAHAAVLLVRAMGISTANVTDPGYKDVSTDHQYYKEIAAVKQSGIMSGKNNNTIFDPNGTLTRAQMAAILTRAYGLEGTITPAFNDVSAEYWAYKEIHALAASGITTGYKADHTFKPNNFVTRAQFSAFIHRAQF